MGCSGPACAPSSTGSSRWWATRGRSTRRCGWSPRRGPTSSCSTCTCPTAAGGRGCAAWRGGGAPPGSPRPRGPAPPRTASPRGGRGGGGAGGDPPRFLALSVSDAAEDVIAVVRAGARGYVTKSIAAEELAEAIRRVQEGDAVFSPRLAGYVLDAFTGAPPAAAEADVDALTPREQEVLRHIARGYMYKEIALRLGISAKTVEAHVSSVLRKLQLSSRHELSRWAAERRLIEDA